MKPSEPVTLEIDVEADNQEKERKAKAKKWVKRQWFVFAFVSTLVVTFLAVLGCISPATRRLYIYNIDTSTLVAHIASLANRSAADLSHPALPDFWSWGLSGVCAVHTSPEKMNCRYAFAPTFSIEDLVAWALDEASTSDADATLSAWHEALSVLQSKQASDSGDFEDVDFAFKAFGHLTRAGGAFVIIAMLIAFADLGLTLLHPYLKRRYGFRPYPKISLWVAAADSLVLGAAVLLLHSSIRSGPARFNLPDPSAADLGKDLGPALPLLVLGAILLIGSVPIIGLVVFVIIPIVAVVVAAFLGLFGLKVLGQGMRSQSGSGGYRGGVTSIWHTVTGDGGNGGDSGGGGWTQYESTQYESTPYEATPTQPVSNS